MAARQSKKGKDPSAKKITLLDAKVRMLEKQVDRQRALWAQSLSTIDHLESVIENQSRELARLLHLRAKNRELPL